MTGREYLEKAFITMSEIADKEHDKVYNARKYIEKLIKESVKLEKNEINRADLYELLDILDGADDE